MPAERLKIALAIALLALPGAVEAQEAPPADSVTVEPARHRVWKERPFKVSLSAGYPQVLNLSFGYALIPTLRVTASVAGLPPFLFGGGIGADYLLVAADLGKNGYVTVTGGLQSLLMKYNFGIVGIQPNGVDWGLGPEFAVDVGFGWFSAGLGVGVLMGDWRCLNRQIGPSVTPGDNLAVSFTLPRLSVNW